MGLISRVSSRTYRKYLKVSAQHCLIIMSKGTSCKDALAQWEKTNEQKAAESEVVKLCAILPPIDKMDSTLSSAKQLSLSPNMIEKITNLQGLKNLTILSLARNNIKNLNGLEAVGETLNELWISYNNIEKLKGVHVLKKLKVLYISNNMVKDWAEFNKLSDCADLEEIVFTGNPLQIAHDEAGDWVEKAAAAIPQLKKLDGAPVIRDE